MAEPDWRQHWQPMIDNIGKQFDDSPAVFSADVVERSAIRRYLEPLEFDCPLHYDVDVARAHGYRDVLLPNSAIPTFSYAPMWQPGETIFTSDKRNAPPAKTAVAGFRAPIEPETSAFFATNYDADYLLPVCAGDRLSRRGSRLLDCKPKETRVGRGAFITWESDVVNQDFEVVARLQTTFFRYNPHVGGDA